MRHLNKLLAIRHAEVDAIKIVLLTRIEQIETIVLYSTNLFNTQAVWLEYPCIL